MNCFDLIIESSTISSVDSYSFVITGYNLNDTEEYTYTLISDLLKISTKSNLFVSKMEEPYER